MELVRQVGGGDEQQKFSVRLARHLQRPAGVKLISQSSIDKANRRGVMWECGKV